MYLSYGPQSFILKNIPGGNSAPVNQSTCTNNVHSSMGNNSQQLEKPKCPSTVKDKCITFYSHNGLLCHNRDESQEKMLREEANHTKKKMPKIGSQFYKIKNQTK